MTYLHIGDLLSLIKGIMTKEEFENYFKEPGTMKNRYLRYIKTNFGMSGAFDKLQRLLRSTDFLNLQQASDKIDWSKAMTVEL